MPFYISAKFFLTFSSFPISVFYQDFCHFRLPSFPTFPPFSLALFPYFPYFPYVSKISVFSVFSYFRILVMSFFFSVRCQLGVHCWDFKPKPPTLHSTFKPELRNRLIIKPQILPQPLKLVDRLQA